VFPDGGCTGRSAVKLLGEWSLGLGVEGEERSFIAQLPDYRNLPGWHAGATLHVSRPAAPGPHPPTRSTQGRSHRAPPLVSSGRRGLLVGLSLWCSGLTRFGR
jgi:hypothetical protein